MTSRNSLKWKQVKVWSKLDIEIKPWLEIVIFVKVNGSIIAIIDPKFDTSAIKTEKIIKGKYKFLKIFNLIIWNI